MIDAFITVFSPNVLIPWILAMALGIFIGAMPGLTATMGVALIVPLTFHMEPIAGLAMILGLSFTSIFAGDIPATFMRVPGTPASGAAVLDGFEMNKKGKDTLAIMLDLFVQPLVVLLASCCSSPFLPRSPLLPFSLLILNIFGLACWDFP